VRLLLDTHTLIWWALSPEKLSNRVLTQLSDPENTLLLSLVSVWEMQIKLQLGKLTLNLPLPELIESQRQVNGLQILEVELTHIWKLADLPNQHRDPFDRLLAAQSLVEHLPLVNVDTIFDTYQVERLW